MSPLVLRTKHALRATVRDWRGAGARIGLVPTMGALHEGHMALVRRARAENDRVIATIFVNPKQFNSTTDLAAYPRTEEDDLARLADTAADVVYLPDAGEIYPAGFATSVRVSGVSYGLCGDFRPGHFEGVATVVTKLLLQADPDRAYFGEKDYQQLMVIRRFVQDLDIPVDIVGCATVREPDGLALSSRNVRLAAAERRIAPALPRALVAAADEIERGAEVAPVLEASIRDVLAAGFARVDYFELRSALSLEPLASLREPARLLAAAWLGQTRLIDNVPVGTKCVAAGGATEQI